jgi:hypothetical protein
MTWGGAFQLAWRRANSSAQSAARQAAASPQEAAGLLSDAVVHTLQLALYAGQDLQRMRASEAHENATPTYAPDLSAITRALQEVQQGHMTAERAQRHIQRAALEASQQLTDKLRNGPAAVPAEGLARRDAGLERETIMRLKFVKSRDQLHAQFAELDGSISRRARPIASGDNGSRGDGPDGNLEFAVRLGSAFRNLDKMFLQGKEVDSPVAPAPAARDP